VSWWLGPSIPISPTEAQRHEDKREVLAMDYPFKTAKILFFGNNYRINKQKHKRISALCAVYASNANFWPLSNS